MPVMSAVEAAFCRSGPWRVFASRRVLPWVLEGRTLRGDVLEIGGGSGAMAQAAARAFGDARITVTDVDPAMVEAARVRMEPDRRVEVQHAAVDALPFERGSFDVVMSFLMLHHVIHWEVALAEVARVLKPGGVLLGYDLTDTRLARLVHRVDGSPHRLVGPRELSAGLAAVDLTGAAVRPAMRSHLMKFSAVR